MMIIITINIVIIIVIIVIINNKYSNHYHYHQRLWLVGKSCVVIINILYSLTSIDGIRVLHVIDKITNKDAYLKLIKQTYHIFVEMVSSTNL